MLITPRPDASAPLAAVEGRLGAIDPADAAPAAERSGVRLLGTVALPFIDGTRRTPAAAVAALRAGCSSVSTRSEGS
jgi:hypothetical protein